MATNVSEKDRTLRSLDTYVNDLDLVEFKHLLRQIRSGRVAQVDDDTGVFMRESFTVHGPTSAFIIDNPTPEEKKLLYAYAGYRQALARVHQWVLANLGYSGGMPSEVPNQSEGADA